MMAILGGVFALMLVFLLVVNLFASEAARGRRIKWWSTGCIASKPAMELQATW